ncbi:MAG: CRISPR-associated endonuclease Cas2 [Thermoprotei archaeon]|nr:MAG: CRISPR-associated endonuclease Cas2 [Thermoprotei archaeon]
MTICLVVYDISNDRMRMKLADNLKSLGLARIQRSAFAGRINSSKLKDLYRICRKYVDDPRNIIHIFTLCGYDWSRRKVFGREIYDEENVVIF